MRPAVFGSAEPLAAKGAGVSLRPRLAVRRPCVPCSAEARRDGPEHESQGRLLGQRSSEAFFKTLKTELIDGGKAFSGHQAVKAAIFEYVEVFYNRRRLHSSLGDQRRLFFRRRQSELLSPGEAVDTTCLENTRLRPATKAVSEASVA